MSLSQLVLNAGIVLGLDLNLVKRTEFPGGWLWPGALEITVLKLRL
jgi:hypothetical protein